jgi:NADH:ubiquinone oxidoreductase subunit 3 (subunit A)
VRLLVFTVIGLIALIVAYAFSLGGTVAALIFLFILLNGILDRWAKPLLDWIKA